MRGKNLGHANFLLVSKGILGGTAKITLPNTNNRKVKVRHQVSPDHRTMEMIPALPW